MAVSSIPSASFVLACQLLASVFAVLGLSELKILDDVRSAPTFAHAFSSCSLLPPLSPSDRLFHAALPQVEGLKWSKVRPFMGISLLFCFCLWTNVKALEYANVVCEHPASPSPLPRRGVRRPAVPGFRAHRLTMRHIRGLQQETVIVFRACSPIAVAFCDYYFLGQALPSLRSWLSLVVIVLGAVLYVLTDDGFVVNAYAWVLCYFVSITAEMVYVKYVVEAVDMSTWSRVCVVHRAQPETYPLPPPR